MSSHMKLILPLCLLLVIPVEKIFFLSHAPKPKYWECVPENVERRITQFSIHPFEVLHAPVNPLFL